MLWHEDWEIAIQDNERIIFADEMGKGALTGKESGEGVPPKPERPIEHSSGGHPLPCWKVLVVDDNRDVQTITQTVLRHYTFEGKSLCMLFASSGAEARELVAQHSDLALILLDVVMESDQAGLETVRYIRNTLGNRFVRIVLRTGQPGFAPEERVIVDYDINDYREKADLSVRQLRSLVTTHLRNYRDLRTIQQLATANQSLDSLVRERTELLEERIRDLADKQEMLLRAQDRVNLGSWLWQVGSDEFVCSTVAYRMLGVTTNESPTFRTWLNAVKPEQRGEVRQVLTQAMDKGANVFRVEHQLAHNGQWVCQQGSVVRHPNGSVQRVEGTILDISLWKQK
ncbi:MAG: PAS domain-containing protein [Magnetococcales bacterium]|nr:PAS domain-containing protein [Magnetococcales bacterium]